MNVDDFKKLKPEYKDLEGEQLWNAMEDYMLRQQAGQEVMKQAVPFLKRYQLRWLFYKRLPNIMWGKNDYTADKRCVKCKGGVSGSKMGMLYMGRMIIHCPHCGDELKEEDNTSIKHVLWKKWSRIVHLFWICLDRLHIVRSTHHGRYDMFGDESKYVHHYTMNMETGKTTFTLKKRKWWEYIFIERSRFNF